MTTLSQILKTHQNSFAPVVPFNKATDKILLMDFGNSDEELTDEVWHDTQAFSNYINKKLQSAGARYGIGGYGELRSIYQRSKVFDASVEDSEPRRLHLGIDIWGKPNTGVRCPLDGIVHSYAFNDRFGDYGATIILSHHFDTTHFYTLYGHLSLNSIKNLREGRRIEKDEIFAEFGIPAENGHWPAHLHFQIIEDIGNWKGDYPGVCKLSEKDVYLKNCPDPDLILNLVKFAHKER